MNVWIRFGTLNREIIEATMSLVYHSSSGEIARPGEDRLNRLGHALLRFNAGDITIPRLEGKRFDERPALIEEAPDLLSLIFKKFDNLIKY